jgi:predicted transcriptional regulator
MTAAEIAERFGCTEEQVRALHRKNSEALAKMADKAVRTRKKVNGYTSGQLRGFAEQAALNAERI